MQKLRAMGGHNETEADKMTSHHAPTHPTNPSEMSNAQSSFLEMLQRGKLAPQNHAIENNNIMNFQHAAMQQQSGAMPGGPGGPMSVEELEARLRGPNTSNPAPPKIEQNFEQNTIQQPNRSTTPQQQDMAAFKKLVRTKQFCSPSLLLASKFTKSSTIIMPLSSYISSCNRSAMISHSHNLSLCHLL